jgi:hypothetical protein
MDTKTMIEKKKKKGNGELKTEVTEGDTSLL